MAAEVDGASEQQLKKMDLPKAGLVGQQSLAKPRAAQAGWAEQAAEGGFATGASVGVSVAVAVGALVGGSVGVEALFAVQVPALHSELVEQ